MSNSVTQLIGRVKGGDEDAAQKLWELYFQRVAGVARNRLPEGKRRASDEEDVAMIALASFFRSAKDGKFSRLNDRNDLWKLLVRITSNKVAHLREHEEAQKRGGGRVLGESALENRADPDQPAPDIGAERPVPLLLDADEQRARSEFAVELNEECRRLLELLNDKELQLVAERKLQGFTLEEIATELGRVPSTVHRKLKRIRKVWSKEIVSASSGAR